MPSPRPRAGTELKIGDLVRQTGVSRSSIQHYVRLGLLPAPRKLGPKLFLFDGRHVEALARVRKLRAQEQLPLLEIRARLRSSPSGVPLPSPIAVESAPTQPADMTEDPRRTAILEVATRLFSERGYGGVRLVDLGHELGLSKAALYRWFDSKEALFVECIDRIRFLVAPRDVREASKREADPELRAFHRVTTVLKHLESYRGLTQLLVTVANGNDRELAKKSRAALHQMVTDVVPELRQAVGNGLYRDVDLELHAYMLWGALMGAGDFMTFVRAEPVKTIARAYLDLIMLGTLPADARSGLRPLR